MSTIHRSCVLLGFKSTVRWGTARFSTVRSIEYSAQGRASTASPIQSRRVAPEAIVAAVVSAGAIGSTHAATRREHSDWPDFDHSGIERQRACSLDGVVERCAFDHIDTE